MVPRSRAFPQAWMMTNDSPGPSGITRYLSSGKPRHGDSDSRPSFGPCLCGGLPPPPVRADKLIHDLSAGETTPGGALTVHKSPVPVSQLQRKHHVVASITAHYAPQRSCRLAESNANLKGKGLGASLARGPPNGQYNEGPTTLTRSIQAEAIGGQSFTLIHGGLSAYIT